MFNIFYTMVMLVVSVLIICETFFGTNLCDKLLDKAMTKFVTKL